MFPLTNLLVKEFYVIKMAPFPHECGSGFSLPAFSNLLFFSKAT